MDASPFELWLEFEHWDPKPGDVPEDGFCNVLVTLPTGEAYALNVWTFKFLERAHRDDREAGEHRSGRSLIGPDLLVTRLDRPKMQEVFTALVQTRQLKHEWRVPAETETSPV